MKDKALVKDDFDRIARLADKKWDHNRHYHSYLLKHIGSDMQLSLDIGCGKGEFAILLSQKSQRVVGMDLSEKMLEAARLNAPNDKVKYIQGDIMELELEEGQYDCIASIATAHHLPMRELMEKAKKALRPGGVFMILDLYQEAGLLDKLISAAAVPLNAVMMLAVEGRMRPDQEEMQAWREHGKHDKYLTLREVNALCREVMPGAKVKRHFYWRYSIIWTKK